MQKSFQLKSKYGSYEVTPVLSRYADKLARQSLQLKDANDGMPVATVSVNFPEVDIPEGYIAVKTWAENEGMLASLIEAGILDSPLSYHEFGAISAPICKLLI
jgi:hypothetical protein